MCDNKQKLDTQIPVFQSPIANIPQQNKFALNNEAMQLAGNGIFNKNSQEEAVEREYNSDYYDEFCRQYLANMTLVTKIKELTDNNDLIRNKICNLESMEKLGPDSELADNLDNNNNDGQSTDSDKKKLRKRKKKGEVTRAFECPVDSCNKGYGSENSLNQHLKIKHQEYWETLKKLDLENKKL